MEHPRRCNEGFDENALAMLDSSGVKEACDVDDDRNSFLEAVRSAYLVPDSPPTPSWKIFNATFQILRESKSLELAVASYLLLMELDKRYPRVSTGGVGELVVDKEAWSPFIIGLEVIHDVAEHALANSELLIDSSRFSCLVVDISQALNKSNSVLLVKDVEDMLVFQYLISVIEADFLPRQTLYKETLDWNHPRESIINILLTSRKLNFKNIVKDCMLIADKLSHHQQKHCPDDIKNANNFAKTSSDGDLALVIAADQIGKGTCLSMQKLLTLILELDVMKKEADLQGCTSRVDGRRTPLLEMVLDELTYNKDQISTFLESSVRTRRSSESSDDTTFEYLLSSFSATSSAKAIIKKITLEVARLLVAHAFQAYLSLQQQPKHATTFTGRIGASSLSQICNAMIVTFQNFRKIDESMEITSFEKEALFTAAVLSEKEP
ncbi:negative regulator of systemic acquired resistance SNI1 isoform X2 [Dioscorea cayenensis subsp. rotundata]|uniref:Negative regulator of systemic acquired resistance SNI1 isoform X2 n=1 Tax=Dioscorea cayennensis subsp. rotundata TaxID=55577 RepID=A0AB40BGT7_DIOCR|nr:negative regulator of systemic acquired resistance SNI1 isoform X2 [Dioscorea cayenensis subsp. rotundata]